MSKKELTREEWEAVIRYGKMIASSKEKKGDVKFAATCSVIAGANLACGNVLGWAVCTLIGLAPMVVHKLNK